MNHVAECSSVLFDYIRNSSTSPSDTSLRFFVSWIPDTEIPSSIRVNTNISGNKYRQICFVSYVKLEHWSHILNKISLSSIQNTKYHVPKNPGSFSRIIHSRTIIQFSWFLFLYYSEGHWISLLLFRPCNHLAIAYLMSNDHPYVHVCARITNDEQWPRDVICHDPPCFINHLFTYNQPPPTPHSLVKHSSLYW